MPDSQARAVAPAAAPNARSFAVLADVDNEHLGFGPAVVGPGLSRARDEHHPALAGRLARVPGAPRDAAPAGPPLARGWAAA